MAKYLGKGKMIPGKIEDEICWLVCGKLLVFICAYVNLYHRDYDGVDC